jgi:hypothetical protein
MSPRRTVPVAVVTAALAAAACQPSISNQSPPATVAFAVSLPDASDGTQSFQPPVPNDLILQAAATPGATPTALATSAAQFALLNAFATGGGWPNDQEVPVQIQFIALKSDPKGGAPTAAPFPDLDTTSITASTLAIVRYDGGTPTAVDFEVAPADYDAAKGVLTVHKKVDPATGSRAWATGPGGGRYVVALRGGSQGVKTKAGDPIAAQTAALLVSQDKDLTQPENQGLLATQADPVAAARRLETIRQLYAKPVAWTFASGAGWVPAPATGNQPSALSAIDKVFPHKELASLQTFVVDPNAHVAVDPGAGIVPLPSEFLMQAAPPASYYTAAGGNPLASHVNVPTTGALAQLAPGLNTLDGFGTSPLLLVPLAGTPVAAATVTGSSVLLLEKNGSTWSKVPDFTAAQPTGRYLTLPPPITADPANNGQPCAVPYNATCVAKVIGLQPAVVVPVGGGNVATLPPLKEHTEYAVIVTNDVKDVAGKSLTPGTLAKVLGLAAPQALGGQGLPLVDGSGKSLLAGVSDANAQQLQGLAPLIANELATDVFPGAGAAAGLTPAKIVTAYTFVTQSITATAQTLAATPSAFGVTGSPFQAVPATLQGVSPRITPDVILKKYGLPSALLQDPANGQFVPSHFLEAALVTLDVLDPATGAFLPPAQQGSAAPTPVPVLIAVPQGAAPASGAPLVIFRHGFGRGRGDMIELAGALTKAGMVVAAIDAAKHGDRSWCTTDADCAAGAACDHTKFGNQGDPATAKPGLCAGGALARNPIQTGIPACSASVTANCWDASLGGGLAKSSASFYLSGNLFRLRDSSRQDILDEAALARAMVGTSLGADGPAIDPNKVFYVGHSLGAINGMVDVAVSPAFKGAVLAAGGGHFIDIGFDSPTFAPGVTQIVAGLGIQPGSAAFLQFLQVAKWVHDPADPVNFAATLAARTIPVLGQAARCDSVVPNTQNQLFYGLLGKSPTNPLTSAPSSTMQWYMQDTTTACPADGSTGQGGATHGFLLDFVNQSLTVKAQTNAVTFLLAGTTVTTPVLP